MTLISGTPPTYEDTDSDPATPPAMVPHSGFQDGPAADALWSYPVDFAIDYANNDLFVADANNHRIRMIDLDTMVVSTMIMKKPSTSAETVAIKATGPLKNVLNITPNAVTGHTPMQPPMMCALSNLR